MIRLAVFFFLASCGIAIACDDGEPLIPDDANAPRAQIILDSVPLSKPFSLFIHVCDQADVGDLNIEVVMPRHQHGLNYTPKITTLDNNQFKIENMVFHMPGFWEFRVTLTQGKNTFQYTYPHSQK